MKSIRMLKTLGTLSIGTGVLIMIGASGASDLNTMSSIGITSALTVGLLLTVGGYIIIQTKQNEEKDYE